MNVNYETYRIFYYVAINENISKASQKLMISQPAVTWHLKNLESNLGVKLFIRTKKGVKLTYEGEAFFEYIKKGIESFNNGEKMLTNLKDLEEGSIRIGASTTVSKYVLMTYLKYFHEKFPNIDIQIINTLTKDLIKELRDGNLDLLLLNMPMEESKDLEIQKVMDVQDIFVGSEKYYKLCKGAIKLQDLNNIHCYFKNLLQILDNF